MADLGECIEYKGCKTKFGYGQVGRTVNGKFKSFLAHRLAYAEVHGPIPEGMCVLHRCDNPPCINPDHLFLGTHTDNMRDMEAKGRGKRSGCKGSNHGIAKLTEADIPMIREMLRSGWSQQSIGDLFGVSRAPIYDIKHGITWTHVAA